MNVTVCELIGPTPWIPGRRDRARGVAVIRAIEAQDLVAAGMDTRHLDRILDRVSTTIGEEDFVVCARSDACASSALHCDFSDPLCRLTTDVIGDLWRHCGQDCCLILDRFDDLWMLEADIGEDQLAREVEILLSVEIPEVGTCSSGNGKWSDLRLCRPGVEDVSAIESEDLFAALGICRDWVGQVGTGVGGRHVPNLLVGPGE